MTSKTAILAGKRIAHKLCVSFSSTTYARSTVVELNTYRVTVEMRTEMYVRVRVKRQTLCPIWNSSVPQEYKM
jgi:hypothetical protein